MRLQAAPDQPLLLLGLAQVVGEQRRQVGVAGDVGRGAELGERLLLDRVGVGEVLDELLGCGSHGLPLPRRGGNLHAKAVERRRGAVIAGADQLGPA